MNEGRVAQIIGAVVDVEFPNGTLPPILNAVKIPFTNTEGQNQDLICEVQQHLGENRVRTVAMDSTDGLARGVKAIDTEDLLQLL